MSISISKRLMKVAEYIPTGSTIADIGSDHAYLPCFCIEKDIARKAVAGEVNQGPYNSAASQVKALQMDNDIEVRLGDGLDVIDQGEVSVVVVAGMGGQLISSILDRGQHKLDGVERLVLQPNVGARYIRVWLQEHNWKLVDETILEEEDKIYEIIVAEPASSIEKLTDEELLLGPFLMEGNNDTFKKKWQRELDNWERVLSQMEHAIPSAQLEGKKKELHKKIAAVRTAFNQPEKN
jgi:tRNA (adenine22-N1)-methyltransferase